MATLNDLMVRVGMQVDEFVNGTTQIAKELDGLARATEKNFAAFDRIGTRLKDFGAGLTAAITLPLAGIAVASVKMAGDFEASMNKVSALGDITGNSLKQLEAQAMDLGAKTKFSAKEAADGMAALASAGLNATQVAESMAGVLSLAAAGELEVGRAAEVATNTMFQFGLQAKDVAHIADVLAKGAADSSISVAQMAESLNKVGGIAKTAGLNLEEVSAALVILGNAGLKGEAAGTALRGMLARILDPSKEAAAAMKQLGLNFTDVAGQVLPLTNIMDQLGKSGITTGQIFKIFGSETADAVAKLKDHGAEIGKLEAEYKKLNGTAEKMAATLSQGIKGAFEKATGSIETLGITIGKALEPAAISLAGFVEAGANKLGELATEFGKLPVPIQNSALAFAGLAAAVGPAVYVLGQFAGAIPNIVSAVKVFQELAASAVVIEALGTALAIAGPLAIAFGVAVAGWAIYTAITEIQKLDHEIDQLRDTLAKGGAATKAQAAEIAALEQTLKSAGKELPKAFDFNDSLKSVTQYTKELQTAVGGLEQFKGKAIGASDALKGGTINIKAAATEYLGLGTATKSAGSAVETLKPKVATLTDAQTKAAEAARKHAIDLQLQADKTLVAWDAVSKYENKLQGLQNIDFAKLTLGGPNFKEYLDGFTRFFAEIEKAKVAVGELYNKMAGTRNVTAALAEIGAAIGNLEKAFDHFGITSTLKYQEQIDENRKYLDTILNDTKASLEQKAQAQITAAEREITIARNAGKEVTDMMIESLAVQKAAYAKAHLDIEQAYKNLGMNSTAEIQRQADLVIASYEKVRDSGISSATDVEKATLAALEAQAAAQIAHGKAITESQKRAMEDLAKVTKEGHISMETQWDVFSNHVGDSIGMMLHSISEMILTGKGSLSAIFTQAWKDIVNSMVSDFIKPAEAEIGKFLTKSIVSLLGKDGIGGVKEAFKQLGEAAKAAFGLATEGAKAAKDASSGLSGFAGDTSEADYIPGAPSGGGGMTGGSGSGGGGIVGTLGGWGSIINAGINAAAGITQGVQMAKLISLTDKIEKSTREVSVVTWQTGGESIQGLIKDIRNLAIMINDRVIDLRDALFAPVALTLEMIDTTLRTVIYSAIKGISGAVQAASDQSQEQETAQTEETLALGDTIQAGIDANNAERQEALAVANGIAGEANRINEEIQELQDLTITTSADSTDAIIGSAQIRNGEIINALGQTTSEAVAATQNSTAAIVAQLEAIAAAGAAVGDSVGATMSNAYTDLKATMIGVEMHSTKRFGEVESELTKAFNDAIFGIDRNSAGIDALFDQNGVSLTRTSAELLEIRRAIDASANMTNAQYADLMAARGTPLTNGQQGGFGVVGDTISRTYAEQMALLYGAPGGSQGSNTFSMLPSSFHTQQLERYYPPADPRTYQSGGMGSFQAFGSNAPRYTLPNSGGEGGRVGTAPIVNFYGPVTDRDYAERIANDAARRLRQAGL